MNLRYFLILSVAVAFGCSKPTPTGDTALNSAAVKPPVDAASNASPTPITVTTGSAPAVPDPKAKTPSVQASQPKAGTGTTGGPPPASKTDPKTPVGATPPAATPPPSAQGQLSPAQMKEMQAQMKARQAAMKKAALENGAKAEKASKVVLDGVKGTYHSYVDESKIPAQVKTQPGYAAQLAQIRAVTVIVGNDGSFTMKGLPGPNKEVSGITSKIDGNPVIVVTNPKPTPGAPSKQFAAIKITDGGGTLQFGMFTLKRA